MTSYNEMIPHMEYSDYDLHFWNAMRGKIENYNRLNKGKMPGTSTYAMAPRTNDKCVAVLNQESLVRQIGTLKKAYRSACRVWTKVCDDFALWVPDGGEIPMYDGMDDFTRKAVDSFKLAAFTKTDLDFVWDADFDFEDHLIHTLAKVMGRAEDNAFINGTGVDITIMSSLAQEESRSISENVTWGRRKQFADGKVSLPYRAFLGYRKGADGLPEIVPEEAEIVKRIYSMFMQGKTSCAIAKILTDDGIPTPSRKQKWSVSTVDSILRNEKYRGDARLQKTFTVDFLQKKMKTNEGEVPQYYVQNSHPAIIDPYEWDLVQAEIAIRKELGQRYSANSVFSATIVCGDCGAFYGAKVWHSTDQYRRTVWQCNDRFKGEHRCTTPHLTEKQIQSLFLRAFSKTHSMRDSILEDCLLVQKELFDCTELDARQSTLAEEMELAAKLVRRCVEENSLKVQDQMEYLQRYERYVQRYEKLKKKYDALDAEKQRRKEQHDRLGAFIATLQTQTDLPVQFEPDLWLAAVEKATVYADHTVVFTFKSGMEITEEM